MAQKAMAAIQESKEKSTTEETTTTKETINGAKQNKEKQSKAQKCVEQVTNNKICKQKYEMKCKINRADFEGSRIQIITITITIIITIETIEICYIIKTNIIDKLDTKSKNKKEHTTKTNNNKPKKRFYLNFKPHPQSTFLFLTLHF